MGAGVLDPEQVRQVSVAGKIGRNDLNALAGVGRGQRHDGPRHNRRIVHGDDGQASRAMSTSWHGAVQMCDDTPHVTVSLGSPARPGH